VQGGGVLKSKQDECRNLLTKCISIVMHINLPDRTMEVLIEMGELCRICPV
jgi:hypothetical protein